MSVNFLLPHNTQTATTEKTGVVKVGEGIKVNNEGQISTDLAHLSSLSQKNGIKTKFDITQDGIVQINKTSGSSVKQMQDYIFLWVKIHKEDNNGSIDKDKYDEFINGVDNDQNGYLIPEQSDSGLTVSEYESLDLTPGNLFKQFKGKFIDGLDMIFNIVDANNDSIFNVKNNGTISAAGTLEISSSGLSKFSGDIELGGNLTVHESANVKGIFNNDAFTVLGNTILGNITKENITTINGSSVINAKTDKEFIDNSIGNWLNLEENKNASRHEINVYKETIDGYNDVFKINDLNGTHLLQVKGNGDTIINNILKVNSEGGSSFDGDVEISGRVKVKESPKPDGVNVEIGKDFNIIGALNVDGDVCLGGKHGGNNTFAKGSMTIESKTPKGDGSNEVNIFNVIDSEKQPIFEISESGDINLSNILKINNKDNSNVSISIDEALTIDKNATVEANFVNEDLIIEGNLIVNGSAILANNASDIVGIKTKLNMYNNKITNIALPTQQSDAATKGYVDNYITGLDVKKSVRVLVDFNIELSGLQVIDGIQIVENDRVLVIGQNDESQNGIYDASSGSWKRSDDADGTPGDEVSTGMFTFIEEGTKYNNTGWTLSTPNPITLGTTSLIFTQFSGAGSVTSGGAGLEVVGTEFNLLPATQTTLGGVIVPTSGGLKLASDGTLGINLNRSTGLLISDNLLSITKATHNEYGTVKIGSGMSIEDGVVSVDISDIKIDDEVTLDNITKNVSPNSIAQRTSEGTLKATDFIICDENGNEKGKSSAVSVSKNRININNKTTVASLTPKNEGNHIIYLYLNVLDEVDDLVLKINYVDHGAEQEHFIVNGQHNSGAYSVTPIFINSDANEQIEIIAQSSSDNIVKISASIVSL